MIQPDFSQTGDPSAPEGSPEASPAAAAESPGATEPDRQVSEAQSTQPNNPTASELLELDKHERFKWKGEEWTLKDLESARLRQADYTRKSQELAKDREFHDNLAIDLDRVRDNPQLEAAFRQTYPEKFHRFLGYVTQKAAANPARDPNTTQTDPTKSEIPEVVQKRLEQLETEIREDKVQATMAQLEAQDRKFQAKYPEADPNSVYAAATALRNQKVNLTEAKWDELWKASHDAFVKRSTSYQQKQVESQREAAKRARETGAGGGAPGQAPKRTRLIDVADQIIDSERRAH